MRKTPKNIILKPISDEEKAAQLGAEVLADELSLPGLEALRRKLKLLRATETLEEPEQVSIRALIAYIAYEKGANEEIVRGLVEKKFGVDDVSTIRVDDYDDVVRFLADLNIKEVMN
ncbi:MAG: hypothetical protein KGI37_04840 [Alphaproteobacteria bacterium]|nr:hypothetical protein [Alphaproteobacteria bacterium]